MSVPAERDVADRPPGRRLGRPRDERASQAILDAALRQVYEVGYANLSMETVAAEAGVARATLYRRYRDKADLVTAAIAASATPMDNPKPANPRRELVRFLQGFDARFAEPCIGVLGALMAAREERHALELHRERTIIPRVRYIEGLLRHAQELGELDPDADVELAVQLLLGAVVARKFSGVSGPASWAQDAVDAIWRADAPRPRG